MPKPLPLLTDSSPVCCPPLGADAPLSRADAAGVAVRLKALADPTRLRLVAYLLASTDAEACTCDLAPYVELSEATVSHHLKQLLDAGLVTKERRGMNVYYRAHREALGALARVLDCC